jgi:hypothetical protein
LAEIRQEASGFQVQVCQFLLYEGKEVGKVIIAKLSSRESVVPKWLTIRAEAFNSVYNPSAAISPKFYDQVSH